MHVPTEGCELACINMHLCDDNYNFGPRRFKLLLVEERVTEILSLATGYFRECIDVRTLASSKTFVLYLPPRYCLYIASPRFCLSKRLLYILYLPVVGGLAWSFWDYLCVCVCVCVCVALLTSCACCG